MIFDRWGGRLSQTAARFWVRGLTGRAWTWSMLPGSSGIARKDNATVSAVNHNRQRTKMLHSQELTEFILRIGIAFSNNPQGGSDW